MQLPSNIVNSFFAPVQPDLLAGLIRSYNDDLANLKTVHAFMQHGDNKRAFNLFLESAGSTVKRDVYDLEETVKLLDAQYWNQALQLTDVFEHMPQARRDEWHEQVRERKCPTFEEDAVYTTIEQLLHNRSRYIAERVDGIFKGLSGEHVTNSPTGFRKRMIMANVVGDWASVCYSKAGIIDDLRKVIAKLLGRDETKTRFSNTKIARQYNYTGEWFDWDGGTLRVRVYKKGTVHLEIHPDIAWQLNQILAFLYPQALSHSSIRKPEKKSKDFNVINNPISEKVLYELSRGKINGMEFEPNWDLKDKVIDILCSVGGVRAKKERKARGYGEKTYMVDVVRFDYSPNEVITKIIVSGELPDKVTHQFYPTPEELAAHVVTMAEIEGGHTVLEPSAGQGGLVDLVDAKHRIQCVEYSELHCEILRAKGYEVERCDFLKYEEKLFDRIIMNPPFSEGRAKIHLEHAVGLLAEGGRLVAILPSGMTGKEIAGGVKVQYSDVLHNQFPDARVSVVICIVEK